MEKKANQNPLRLPAGEGLAGKQVFDFCGRTKHQAGGHGNFVVILTWREQKTLGRVQEFPKFSLSLSSYQNSTNMYINFLERFIKAMGYNLPSERYIRKHVIPHLPERPTSGYLWEVARYFGKDYEWFMHPLVNLAVNNPELCIAVLKKIFPSLPSERDPFLSLNEGQWPYDHEDPDGKYDLDRRFRRFVELCAQYQGRFECGPNFRMELYMAEQQLNRVMKELYNHPAAKLLIQEIKFGNNRAMENVAKDMLDRDDLAQFSTVNVIVRKNEELRGNAGHFVIYLEKGSTSCQLIFKNKNSVIYYLMCLIDAKNHHELPRRAIHLRNNQNTFKTLYKTVYDDIEDKVIAERTERMLTRYVDGKLRAGRLGETICDIREHVEGAFLQFDECCQPYLVTIHSHLAIPSDLITFEGEAEKLLDLRIF